MNQLLRILSADQLSKVARRPVDPDTLQAASAILADIEARGDQAAIEYAIRFGDLSSGDPFLFDRMPS